MLFQGVRVRNGLFVRPAALLLSLGLTVFASTVSFAADFAAEIVDVYGQALIIPKATGKAVAAVKGMKLAPGDALETKARAELELLYDDGNITRIDEKTKLTITRMSMEDDKSKQTILNLAVGRVKNSVSKLSHEKSKFEVQTTSAVAGVTGTPPWVVAAIGDPGKKQKVEVDLLPEKPGAANHTAGVFVKGTDAGATKVVLSPGTGTFAMAGKAPVMPAPIPPAKLQQLQTAMKIATPPQVQEQKKKELEQKIEEKKEDKKEDKKEEPKKEEEKKDKEEAKKEEEKKTEEKAEEKAEEKKEEAKKEDPGKKEEPKQEETKKEDPKPDASKEEPQAAQKDTAADSGEKKADATGGGDKPADAPAVAESSTGGSKGGDGGVAAEPVSVAGVAGGAVAEPVSAALEPVAAESPKPAAPVAVSPKADPSPAPASPATPAAPAAPATGAFAGGFTGGGAGTAGAPDTSGMMNHLTNNVSVANTVPGTQTSATGDSTGAAALPGANQNTLPAAMTKVRVLVTITNK